MRLRRFLLAAPLLCLLAPSWAMACQGQVGKTLFEDDFSSRTGGWDLTADDNNTKLQDSALVISFNDQHGRHMSMVRGYDVPEGDFCIDVVLPPSLGPHNVYGAGILFWMSGYLNHHMVDVYSNGDVFLMVKADGKFTYIGGVRGAPSFRAGPSVTNELRAVVKGGEVKLYLNGSKLETFHVTQPSGPLHFGVDGDVDKPNPALSPIRIIHLKVTSGEPGTAP